MLIKFGGEKIAELISKRYELKLEEQLSDYNHQQEIEIQKLQTRLEEKIYVSRNRFDKEFNFIEEFLSKYFEFASLLWNVYITKESPEYTEAFEKLWDASEEFIKFYYMLQNDNLQVILLEEQYLIAGSSYLGQAKIGANRNFWVRAGVCVSIIGRQPLL